MDILNTPAQPVEGRPGTTDTAVLVRFSGGQTIPVGVQVGHCATEYLSVYNTEGGVVVGVRRGGVTVDTLREPTDLLREARRRLLQDAVLRYRAEYTARVLAELRAEEPDVADDDRIIAAIALTIADLELPGADKG